MQAGIERTHAQMVERIVKRFAQERIILFGSHAAGRAGPDSDVDLLVVMTPNRSIGRRRSERRVLYAKR